MKELGYTTSILSWQIVLSSIKMLENSESEIEQIDLNLDAISCCILSSAALEAFSNEISSLTHAFNYNVKQEYNVERLSKEQISKIGIDFNICENIEQIRNDDKASFYDRYKKLLTQLNKPESKILEDLCHLRDIRNSLVHFRLCDISVIEKDGVIKSSQKPPGVFNQIKSFNVNGWPIIASDVDDDTSWHLRISTNAFAFWSIILILDAIIYFLDKIPQGTYRDFIIKYYGKNKISNVFEGCKYKVQELLKIILDKKELNK